MRHSYSKISTYMKCPLMKRGKYDLKIRDETGPAAQRGLNVHAVFELAVLEQQPLPDEFSFYDDYIKKLAGSKCEHKVAVDRNWQPVPFDSPDAWLVGILDLWTTRGTRGTLLDWKTGKEYPDHVFQKQFYACLMAAHHPELEVIDATNVYVDRKTIRTHTFTRHMIPNAREVWTARIERMERDEICAPSPGPHCRYCPVSHNKGGPCQF